MTHRVHAHNDAQPKRRGLRLAMVFASTAFLSGVVILPATAATATVRQPAPASAVTDGGKGGNGEEGCAGDCGPAPWNRPAGTGGAGGDKREIRQVHIGTPPTPPRYPDPPVCEKKPWLSTCPPL